MDHAADGRQWQRRREDAGLDQAAAASALDVHPQTLSRYERGARPIPPGVRAAMAALYRHGGADAPVHLSAADGSAAAADPQDDPAYWVGYLAAANEMLSHAYAIIGTANGHLSAMLASRARRIAPPRTAVRVPLNAEDAPPVAPDGTRARIDATRERMERAGVIDPNVRRARRPSAPGAPDEPAAPGAATTPAPRRAGAAD